ncbi:zinc-binding metallopeptidase family protein [Aliarcobacter cryaerophilus]|uniref:aminoacyl-histidine dipeptidase n=1 Tax=Aliarcobacter cryaerophilus TaxID=28198 RepID=UPI0021B6AA88|nr:aminoacyl-histidine dipeptidase [Aliarcobacter cryaerophilus]MCT7540620.1 aminoacyl-histidine dipeptidase [Aliarcobacter cryaerophilus]
MPTVLEIFKEITKIQRCSGNHKDFIEYMKEISKKLEYNCLVDEANNILCKKENSNANIVFQSHYDIVCLNDFCIPQIVEDDTTLKAIDSTLGADNGIGCSYMIALMYENFDGEFLFTSDEEIGLIGANGLNLPINSKYMLNLDSEDEGKICIGCAGGVDIIAKNSNKKIVPNIENLDLYEISISNLQGGHSGVDIDKNIPNAIKLIVKTIKECEGKILDINGGERINSIPANAKAIIASKKRPQKTHENMKIEKINTKSEHLNIYDDEIINFLYNFQNGVRDFNKELNVVQDSINLALIKTNIDEIVIEFSSRSMNNENLKELKEKTKKDLINNNFYVETYGKYPAWSPDINDFTSKVLDIYKTFDKNASLEAIHAGLECAIFKDKFPNLKIASIGPTIKFPHSKKEFVYKKSIENVFEVVKKIANSI